MDLGDRKRLILQAIIEDYVNTAEPVGSRTISKKYLTDVSAATIRNEMADLEEMGYIEQPHTSAGRIPSDKGYRLYVDKIMEQKSINANQKEIIKKEFYDTLGEIDKMVKHASKLLSQLTNYTTIVMAPQLRRTCIKQIQLIKLDQLTVLAVIVTDAGVIKNSVLRLLGDVPMNAVERITRILNDKLIGLSLEEISEIRLEDMIRDAYHFGEVRGGTEVSGYVEIIEQILPELIQALQYSDTVEIYHDGIANILNLPEYNDLSKARHFINALEEKDILFQVLNEAKHNTSVSIGSENQYEQFRDCSLITATYQINGKTIGSVGVIGPTRMEYSRVISIVDCMTNNLSDILTKIMKR